MSKIIKLNVASILNNDESGERVSLSIAYKLIDGNFSYFIISDSGEDCGPHFETLAAALDAIDALWGKSAEWDLQYS
jgi:hypothetical protein